MNKDTFIKRLSIRLGVSHKEGRQVLDTVLELIMEQVEHGEPVQIVGFGTFEAKGREARTGTHPHTKEPIAIPTSYRPLFHPSTVFRNRVRKGYGN